MNNEDAQLNLPQREEKILKFWEENRIFEHTLEKTKKGKPFIFYEGPPFANGHPGIHHVEARVFKDVFLRFKTMQGFFVRRKAGWDTHGLPAELQVEKELGLKTKRDIERYGIGRFNEKCRESVLRYKQEWEAFTKRIGFWLDLKNAYVTYENSYIESLWFIIKRFWETKNLYQNYKIIPWCSRCGTGLSFHELGQPGAYRKIKDPSIFVKFPIKGKKNEYLLVWTTTPWTLPGNVLISVNPKVVYTKFLYKGEYLWSATRPPLPEGEKIEEGEKVVGKKLIGFQYEAPYPATAFGTGPQKNIPYTVVGGDFVSAEEGTGFVHIAPAFGEDDMAVAKKEFGKHYPILMTVTAEGKMEKGIIGEGLFVKEADKTITLDLEKRRLLLKMQWYEHDYPFCWRCDTPLLYLARKAWWVKKPVAQLVQNNKKIHWFPDYIKEGRFGEWLREPKDWAFSRERYWGVPLPIWLCGECGHTDVIGSVEELFERTSKSSNLYYLMRHGQSEANLAGVIDDSNTFHLTERGKTEARKALARLQKEKIDVIFASDILRTKETAEIVSKALNVPAHYDARIQEIHLGDEFRGKPISRYHERFPTYEEKFENAPLGGESVADVRARVMSFIRDIDTRYSNKRILIVSHEYPLWILWGAGQGMAQEKIIRLRTNRRAKDFIKTGEVLQFSFSRLPYSPTGEVDLHRPYVDEIAIACSACKKTTQRVSEVCDVWFDSGAMPFAQDHWPFAFQKSKGKYQNIDISKFSKIPKGFWFPAEFICEGVDQTRGWFYTLLTVSTLLGFGSPYKNVVSLGHVLDKNGQKMSKSKGNVVEPLALIQKYGVDALRWYFYTINSPGDSKLFDEKDLGGRVRGFFNTFWNSYLLFETYAPKKNQKSKIKNQNFKNILDRWILSCLQGLVEDVTQRLSAYDPVGAAREIDSFLTTQFSQWYLRRSRRRFQRPKDEKELYDVSAVSAHVLSELSRLSAPFTPFFSEIIFQKLRSMVGARELSVHTCDWPRQNKKFRNTKLEKEMAQAIAITADALKKRAEAGIKVRQPLSEFTIPKTIKFSNALLLEIIKEEINVKKISRGDVFFLDTRIPPELKEEGFVRELTRNIQEMRKDGGMKPKDEIFAHIECDETAQAILEKWRLMIQKEIGAREIIFGGKRQFTVEREMREENSRIWIGIRKR